MIRLCTCTGVSASASGTSKRQAAKGLCKTCGGKPVIDGKGSSSNSFLSSVPGVTSLTNSDLTWTKVSKGYRSSSRRPRRSVGINLKAGRELVNKDSKDLEMPVSESEKLGVSVLGCRFGEKAEHVPIKKRRFLFRTPSPPHKSTSPCAEGTEVDATNSNTSVQAFQLNPDANHLPAVSASAADLGQTNNNDCKADGSGLIQASDKIGGDEDFSGISILAAAACSNSLAGDIVCGEDSVVVSSEKESVVTLIDIRSKEDDVKSSNRLTEGIDSGICPVPSEGAATSRINDSFPDRKIMDGPSPQVHSVVAPQELPSKKNLETSKTQESAARDQRLHWDLNTVMDAWQHPFECQYEISATDVGDSNLGYSRNEKHGCEKENSGVLKLGREYEEMGQALLPVELRSSAPEIESKMEEHKLDGCTESSGTVTFQADLLTSAFDSAPELDGCTESSGTVTFQADLLTSAFDSAPEVVKEIKFLPGEEKNDPDGGSFALFPNTLALMHPASKISAKCAKVNCKSTDHSSCCEFTGMNSLVNCSLRPGSDDFASMLVPEETFKASSTIGCRNNVNDSINDIQTFAITPSRPESEKQDASLTTVAFPENGAVESGSILNQDDGDGEQKSTPINEIIKKNLISKVTDLPQEKEPLDDFTENAVIESNERVSYQSTDTKLEILTTPSAVLNVRSPVVAEKDHPAGVSSVDDAAKCDTKAQPSAEKFPSPTISGKSMTLLMEPSCLVSEDVHSNYVNDHVSCSDKGTFEVTSDNGFVSDISQGDIQPGGGIDKIEEHSAGYDSQYEDGELRESNLQSWEGYEGEYGEAEYVSDNNRTGGSMGFVSAPESSFQYGPEGSSRMRVADAGSGRGSDEVIKGSNLQSSGSCLKVLLSEKADSGEKGSGPGPDEMISGNGINERQNNPKIGEWKMNLSGSETPISSSGIVSKFRVCSNRRMSSGDHRDGMAAEDMERKVDSSRSYMRESPLRIGGPSPRDACLRRSSFRVQGCSSNDAEDSNPRSERESGSFRSFGRGKYTPYIHSRSRGGDSWAHSPENDRGLKRYRSPYQGAAFRRSGLDDDASESNIPNWGAMESIDGGRQTKNAPAYVPRRSFKSRSPMDKAEAFRLRLGLRPTGDTGHDRFLNVGRGRSVRYGSRFNGGGPRGRYHGPASDDCDIASIDYSPPFSRRRRCFSPAERRGNNYGPRQSISRSRSRSRTRSPVGCIGFRQRNSRSPNFRSDARMRRATSPSLRRGFETDHVTGFISGPRNHTSPPPNSRWLNYKQRSSVFDRRSPGRSNPRGDRFSFYDSRKQKEGEFYRSGHPGRFSELSGVGRGGPRYEGNDDDDRRNHGYRRGFMRRYDQDGAVKRFRYHDEDGFSPGFDSRDKDAPEFHGRGNLNSSSSGIDSRIVNFRRRSKEDRDALINKADFEDKDALITKRDGIPYAD